MRTRSLTLTHGLSMVPWATNTFQLPLALCVNVRERVCGFVCQWERSSTLLSFGKSPCKHTESIRVTDLFLLLLFVDVLLVPGILCS